MPFAATWMDLHINVLSDGIQPHHFMANRWENNGNRDGLYFPRL